MFITLINDSRDDNSMARIAARLSSLLDSPVHLIGAKSDIEASGNLVDMLDAGMGHLGAVIVNVAPRQGGEGKRENGSPFAYFFYKDTLVVATLDGFVFSLVKKFKLIESVELLDMSEVLSKLGTKHGISEHQQARIKASQFRSYEFLPHLTKWIIAGESVPSTTLPIERIPDAPMTVWWIDSFGNCKTTVTPNEIQFTAGKKISTRVGELTCYLTLKDVPDGEAALVIGSSGLDSYRLLEIVVQGGNAATTLGLQVGRKIF